MYMHVGTYAWLYVYMYVYNSYMYVCINLSLHVYTHIHRLTHTLLSSLMHTAKRLNACFPCKPRTSEAVS